MGFLRKSASEVYDLLQEVEEESVIEIGKCQVRIVLVATSEHSNCLNYTFDGEDIDDARRQGEEFVDQNIFTVKSPDYLLKLPDGTILNRKKITDITFRTWTTEVML
jgi:hypothetical protein